MEFSDDTSTSRNTRPRSIILKALQATRLRLYLKIGSTLHGCNSQISGYNDGMRISVAEARDKLTQLLAAVEKGEPVTICRHGKPVADLVQTREQERVAPEFGKMKGKVKILDPDWDRAQNDLQAWLRGDV